MSSIIPAGKLEWQNGLQQNIEQLCDVFPALIRQRWKERLVVASERLACYEGAAAVTTDIFWRAVYEVFPGGYEPLILKVRDPEALKADMLSSRSQEDLQPGSELVMLTRWGAQTSAAEGDPRGKKVIAVTSSPRKGGNTDVIIDELLRALTDSGAAVKKFYLSDMNIKPCTGCRACRKTDVKTICTVRDDMTPFYDRLFETDGFIMGFPIYTARENGIMANFMDRWDCFANPYLSRKMPGGKQGFVVCSWMWPNSTAYDNIVENMIILLRLHGVETKDALIVSGTRGKKHGRGVIKNHPDLLARAYSAGLDFSKQL